MAQTCNLRADVAHLTGQLQRAQDQVSTCEQQLQAAEADLAEQRVAAAAAADNAAGAGAATAARLAELEARCAEQQGELAALRARAEAQEAAFIATAAERKAEQQVGAGLLISVGGQSQLTIAAAPAVQFPCQHPQIAWLSASHACQLASAFATALAQRHHAELQALQQECDKYKEVSRGC